jgi:hypothetical protein
VKTSYKEEKNYAPFSNHKLLWQQMPLQQIKSLTMCIFGGLGVIFCEGLSTYVFY